MQSSLLRAPVGVSAFRGSQPRSVLPTLSVQRRPLAFRCSAKMVPDEQKKEQAGVAARLSKPVAAALAACLLLGAAVPEEALAARSGGRAGGSSFRSSAPRSAPAPRSGYVSLK